MKQKNDRDIKIDFVVAWVDGNDTAWQEKRKKYSISDSDNSCPARFRDWDLFKFWFRSIEENAPWVNKVYLIVDHQIPDFLNTNHPKLVVVNHEDYIPEEYLPTFSSHTIEINFHRIKGLSDFFVYFNDDMYINSKISKSFFFRNKKPTYSYIERKSVANGDFMSSIVKNDMNVVNRNIKRQTILKKPWKFINPLYGKYGLKNILLINKEFQIFEDNHLACPFLKSTFEEVWNKEQKKCVETSHNKFRDKEDINQYVFKYYDLARGNFTPKLIRHGGYYLVNKDSYIRAINDIKNNTNPLICINDNSSLSQEEFVIFKEKIYDAFENRYFKKSSFEK